MSTRAVEPPVSASAGSVRRARRRDLRLAPVAGSAWLAAGVATRWPESAAILAAVCAAMAAVAVCLAVWGARTVRPSAAPALALVAAAGALAGAAAAHVAMAQPARAEALALPVSGGRAAEAQVTAVGKVEPTATGWQFDAVLETLTIGAQRHHPGIPVLVRVTQTQEGLDLGSRVRVSATLSPADAGRREVLVVRAAGVAEVIAPPPGILGAASALRHGLAAVTGSLPQPGAGLVAGLSVGDTSRVPDELDAAMKTTSLSHLTAVSGKNPRASKAEKSQHCVTSFHPINADLQPTL